MFVLCLGVNNHIVQVYQGIREVLLPQTVLHEALKHRRSMTQTVGHVQELIDTHATDRKSSILSGLLSHLDLPEPIFQVHTGEVSGTHHTLHGLLHPR